MQALPALVSSGAQTQNVTAPPQALQSAIHAPVVDADVFDTLREELEAEAARRMKNPQTVVEARSAEFFAAVTVPVSVSAYTRAAICHEHVKFLGIVFFWWPMHIIGMLFPAFIALHRSHPVLAALLALPLVLLLLLQLSSYRNNLKRLTEETLP